MNRTPTIAVKVFLINVEAATSAGVKIDVPALLNAHGLDSKITDNKDARIPLDIMREIIDTCERDLNNPVFGLHYHRYVNWNRGHDIQRVIQISPDAHTALSLYFRYSGLMTEAGTFLLDIGGAQSIVSFAPNELANISRHQIDANIVAFTLFTRLLGWPAFDQVDFAHPCPTGFEQQYQQVFACPITFDAPQTRLLFSTQHLKKSLPPPQQALETLAQYESRYNEQGGARLVTTTRTIVKYALTLGEPSRERVAKSLGLSVRTFQRRLMGQQTTFADIVNDTRKTQAYEYLCQNIYGLDEIAFLLGYGDARSFYRAFYKWFDCTPGEMRWKILEAKLKP